MLRLYAIPLPLLLIVSACGGGGGGSGVALDSTGTVASDPDTSDPVISVDPAVAVWQTAEYRRSTGLALISAAEAYAARTTGLGGGSGIRVGIMDSGIDFTHPEFTGGEAYVFANQRYTSET